MTNIEHIGDFSKKPQKENLPEVTEEKISDKYSLIQRGAMKYIVNQRGEVVSNGYHEFKVFEHGNIKGLIGKGGSMSKLLKFPENEGAVFEESPANFHDLQFDDELGLLISATGAMSYIINMNTGKKISDGYHEFFMKDGKLHGRTGTLEEEVIISDSPQIENQKQIGE